MCIATRWLRRSCLNPAYTAPEQPEPSRPCMCAKSLFLDGNCRLQKVHTYLDVSVDIVPYLHYAWSPLPHNILAYCLEPRTQCTLSLLPVAVAVAVSIVNTIRGVDGQRMNSNEYTSNKYINERSVQSSVSQCHRLRMRFNRIIIIS